MSVPLQQFSHYPAMPPPVRVRMAESSVHDCPYLPGRRALSRAFRIEEMDGDIYQDFMDAGFRRSGDVVYQPMCPGCRECIPLRVRVGDFAMSKSQRRVWRRNADVAVHCAPPQSSEQKYDIYRRYVRARHGRDEVDLGDFGAFLYSSPVPSLEFEYRIADELIGASICDLSSGALSSVYMYFEPSAGQRSPGVFSALYEIQWARQQELQYYYLGYWVADCASMRYKADYSPHEILRGDGLWVQSRK